MYRGPPKNGSGEPPRANVGFEGCAHLYAFTVTLSAVAEESTPSAKRTAGDFSRARVEPASAGAGQQGSGAIPGAVTNGN
jgi:hypothetical protein